MLEIHEVYEYVFTQSDTASGEGGLFVEYINTFLKLKAEASGFPYWVRSPSDEELYIKEFRQSEGITLNKDSICHNALKRGLAKLSHLTLGKGMRESNAHSNKTDLRSPGPVQVSGNTRHRSGNPVIRR